MSEIKHIEPKRETQLYDDVCQIIDGARGSRAETFTEEEIISATQRQLTWTRLQTLPFVGTFMPEEHRNASGGYQGAKFFGSTGFSVS